MEDSHFRNIVSEAVEEGRALLKSKSAAVATERDGKALVRELQNILATRPVVPAGAAPASAPKARSPKKFWLTADEMDAELNRRFNQDFKSTGRE